MGDGMNEASEPISILTNNVKRISIFNVLPLVGVSSKLIESIKAFILK